MDNFIIYYLLFFVLLHQMLLFIAIAEISENNLSFKNDILTIENHLHSNKTFAKLELKIKCYIDDKEKESFNNKTAVWSFSCNESSHLKISILRKTGQDGEKQSVKFNFALLPSKLNTNQFSRKICLVQNSTISKWYLYNDFTVYSAFEPILYHKYGFVLIIDDLQPWTLKQDNNELCFVLDQDETKRKIENVEHFKEYYTLKWSIIMAASTRKAHELLTSTGYLRKPKKSSEITAKLTSWISSPTIPATAVLQQKAQNSKVLQEFLQHYLSELKKMRVQHVHVLLGSDWADNYDQFKTNTQMLPNFTFLLKEFNAQNQYFTVPLSPIFNSFSSQIENENLFLPLNKNQMVIDLSQSEGAHWLTEQWINFTSKYPDIDGIFCTNGDAETLEGNSIQKHFSNKGDPVYQKYPNFLTTKYGQICSDSFGPNRSIFTSTAYKSQHLLQVISLSTSEDESKLFTSNNELTANNVFKKLFARMMATSLAGYPLLMPRMAPLNHEFPSKSWMQRWLQLTACLPFVYYPANLGSYPLLSAEVLKQNELLRSKLFIPRFLAQAEVWQETGEPIIRPLWYSYPEDEEALHVENQFLVGDDLMVALVDTVNQNETDFITYFPGKGTTWTIALIEGYNNFNENSKQKLKNNSEKFHYNGSQFYKVNYPIFANVDNLTSLTLPCFIKM